MALLKTRQHLEVLRLFRSGPPKHNGHHSSTLDVMKDVADNLSAIYGLSWLKVDRVIRTGLGVSAATGP